jgi:hypothetical protein
VCQSEPSHPPLLGWPCPSLIMHLSTSAMESIAHSVRSIGTSRSSLLCQGYASSTQMSMWYLSSRFLFMRVPRRSRIVFQLDYWHQ